MSTVAIASEFLDAFARIPRAQQKKVREFAEKFQTDPKSPAINYEKIHGVKDSKVRTVRIDQKYRAVILHPGQGDVYVLTWVDNHDEAMVMILAGINAGVMPIHLQALEGDPASKAEHESRERSLMFVAATRARDMLIVSSWGKRSPFVPG